MLTGKHDAPEPSLDPGELAFQSAAIDDICSIVKNCARECWPGPGVKAKKMKRSPSSSICCKFPTIHRGPMSHSRPRFFGSTQTLIRSAPIHAFRNFVDSKFPGMQATRLPLQS